MAQEPEPEPEPEPELAEPEPAQPIGSDDPEYTSGSSPTGRLLLPAQPLLFSHHVRAFPRSSILRGWGSNCLRGGQLTGRPATHRYATSAHCWSTGSLSRTRVLTPTGSPCCTLPCPASTRWAR